MNLKSLGFAVFASSLTLACGRVESKSSNVLSSNGTSLDGNWATGCEMRSTLGDAIPQLSWVKTPMTSRWEISGDTWISNFQFFLPGDDGCARPIARQVNVFKIESQTANGQDVKISLVRKSMKYVYLDEMFMKITTAIPGFTDLKFSVNEEQEITGHKIFFKLYEPDFKYDLTVRHEEGQICSTKNSGAVDSCFRKQ